MYVYGYDNQPGSKHLLHIKKTSFVGIATRRLYLKPETIELRNIDQKS